MTIPCYVTIRKTSILFVCVLKYFIGCRWGHMIILVFPEARLKSSLSCVKTLGVLCAMCKYPVRVWTAITPAKKS